MSERTAALIVPIQIASPEFEVYLENLTFSMESAVMQTAPCEKIVVDYMSSTEYGKRIRHLCEIFEFRYVRDNRPDPLWSRGRALNTGIQNSVSDVVLFFDADCVLPPRYVQEHLQAIKSNVFTYSQWIPTRKTVVKSGVYADLAEQAYALLPTFPTSYSHMGILKNWINMHGGFDEEYRGWGAEDDALWATLTKHAQVPQNIVQQPIHLWHPTWQELMNSAGRKKEQEQSLIENRTRYYKYIGKKVKVTSKRKPVY